MDIISNKIFPVTKSSGTLFFTYKKLLVSNYRSHHSSIMNNVARKGIKDVIDITSLILRNFKDIICEKLICIIK
jgi:hypothetical protein